MWPSVFGTWSFNQEAKDWSKPTGSSLIIIDTGMVIDGPVLELLHFHVLANEICLKLHLFEFGRKVLVSLDSLPLGLILRDAVRPVLRILVVLAAFRSEMTLLAEVLEDHLIAEDRVEPRVANEFLEVLLRVAVAQVAHDVPHVSLLLRLFLVHRGRFAHYLEDGLEVSR